MREADRASPTVHWGAALLVAAFAVALGLSMVLKVEITARGNGRVVPTARVQVIQPEFSGRIIDIRVRDGDHVEKGALLAELDRTKPAADVHLLDRELRQLAIERARIETLLEHIDALTEDDTPVDRQVLEAFTRRTANMEDGPYLDEQRALLAAEVTQIRDSLAQISSRQDVSVMAQAVAEANFARIEAALHIQEERLHMSEELKERGATSQRAYLDAYDSFVGLERQLEVQRRERDQKASEVNALDAERREFLSSLRSRHTQRRSEIRSRMLTANEELRVAQRQLDATRLVAPVTGIVDGLKIHTIGGIAQAGDEIMHIVPSNGGVEVEAVFSNADIGFLQQQQLANIDLDAFPAERFGYVRGRVADVSADAIELDPGRWGFVVRITLDTPYLDTFKARRPLKPGLTASVDVITGERRLISYFFAPIIETIQGSLGER